MTLPPEIQSVLVDGLKLVVPAFALWVVARLEKARKDLNAYHEAKRALEKELGVETQYDRKTRRLSVTRISNGKAPHSQDPQGLDQSQNPG